MSNPLTNLGNAAGLGGLGSSAPAGTRAQGGSWATGSGNCSGILSSNSIPAHSHSNSLPGSLQSEYDTHRLIEMIRGTCNAQSIPIDLLATILPDMLHCTKAMAGGKEDKAAAERVLVAMMKRRMNNQTKGA